MKEVAENFYNASPTWLQSILISAYGYNLFRKRYMGETGRLVRAEIARVNGMSRDQQTAYQAEKMHEMVSYCHRTIPYYQDLFAEYGYTDQDFTDLSDLHKLPILEKQTIKDNPEKFRAPGTKPYMVQHTSGSTGTPLSLWVDEYTYKLAMELLVDHEQRSGVPFKSRKATFAGRLIQPISDMSPPFSRFNRAENQRLFSAYHINDESFPHYKRELDEFQPVEIIGYPSAIYEIANQYHMNNLKPGFQPKAVITNSETLLEWQRETIESVFNCKVFDYYGTAEYITFSRQCEFGSYHISPIIGVTQTPNISIGTKNSDPNIGEIICSTLTNKAMPLINYKVGDTSSIIGSVCSCNESTYFFQSINGRVDDYILTKDHRRIGRIDHIFKGLENIREAQVIQRNDSSCDIRVVRANKHQPIDCDTLLSRFKSRTNESIHVKITYSEFLEKGPNGKFRAVINEMEES